MMRRLRQWVWGKVQHTIWHTKASKDQLDQIIWRLEMNESSAPPDTKAALGLARMLRKRVYGEGQP